MKTDELMSENVGHKCSKNSIIVILGVWGTHEADTISVLKELVIYMHGNGKEDKQEMI